MKPKDLVLIPQRIALAAQAAGWWVRSDIIWAKPNPMPESVKDRPTSAYEHVLMLTKSGRYYWDQEEVRENLTESSLARLSQDVESQEGSYRVPGKTNGTMKAVARNGWHGSRFTDARDLALRPNIQPEERRRKNEKSGIRTMEGFNASWESTEHAPGRNIRDVWTIPTQPFTARALGGGRPDIASPDCPVHGDSALAKQARRHARDDALTGLPWPRTLGNDTDPFEWPEGGFGATNEKSNASDSGERSEPAQTPGSNPVSRRNDSPAASYDLGDDGLLPSHTNHKALESNGTDASERLAEDGSSAIARSKRSRRTEGGLILDGRLGEETDDRSPYISPLGVESGKDGYSAPAKSETRGRTGGISCSCPIIDHFATFPEAIPDRCIRAATSEHGVCGECGAPWERVVQVEHPDSYEGKEKRWGNDGKVKRFPDK